MKPNTTQTATSTTRLRTLLRDGRQLERALGIVLWLALFAVLLGR